MTTQGGQGALGRVWQGVVTRESARVRDAFLASESPPASARAVWGLVAAWLVVLAFAASVLLGAWWLLIALGVGGAPDITRGVVGFLGVMILLFAWLAFPRPYQPEGLEVSAQDAPELHALVARVAAELSVPGPVRVVLDGQVNASMGLAGWRREPVLALGVPLWWSLSPQGQVGLIAHELAHLRNGDPARGGVVALAFSVLERLAHSLLPDLISRSKEGLMPMITNALMTLLALLPMGAARLLAWLIGADSQAAEFRADLMAARVAGSDAVAVMLDRMHMAHLLDSALHKQRHMPERPHVFAEYAHMLDTVPEEQWAAQRAALGRTSLDDSHPATMDRVQVVLARPQPGTVHLTPKTAEWIRLELTPVVRPIEAKAQEWRQYLLNH
ncbi:M48 family metalloprotease [Deinococcus radiotolerans]|uniref:Peptidase M48 domain-containing protein n=1 Tax=Deinococcus radiotolerans TaxID=1309407 RepID=A0ABQ2FIH7_9DEIO|nr:M48 family metallopeptidase [Deinococcus radiotolerans]GGK96516.1 hypothetical protein GCM10010844_13640 [Deinococcus radiotolerans]